MTPSYFKFRDAILKAEGTTQEQEKQMANALILMHPKICKCLLFPPIYANRVLAALGGKNKNKNDGYDGYLLASSGVLTLYIGLIPFQHSRGESPFSELCQIPLLTPAHEWPDEVLDKLTQLLQ